MAKARDGPDGTFDKKTHRAELMARFVGYVVVSLDVKKIKGIILVDKHDSPWISDANR